MSPRAEPADRFPPEAAVQDWIRDARSGREEAFRKLVEAFAGPLQGMLYRILQDWEEARDAAQETFVRVHRALPRYESRARFHAWLFQIGARQALDALRKRGRRPVAVELDPDLPAESGAEPAAERNETVRAIERAIQELPSDLRAAFVLAEYEDLAHAEIAAALDCSAKAVEMKIHRARQSLREQLRPLLRDA